MSSRVKLRTSVAGRRAAWSWIWEVELPATLPGRLRWTLILKRWRGVADLLFVPMLTAFRSKPGCMDAICCSAALHHFIDPQIALREMHRCARKRGKLFLSVPHRFPPTGQIDDRRRFTREEILRLLETTGWSLDECVAIGGRNWTVSRALLERAFPDHGGLFKLRLLALGIPVLLVALACFYLDKMRRPGDVTLGWAVIARREAR